MFVLPEKLGLANLPTKIEYLGRLSNELGKNIYIKRDDQTGIEYSGNKIRKLEFAVKDALNKGCDTLITCGGIQSNHARATAAVAARVGMKSYLVLKGNEDTLIDGNYFIDKIFGAKIKFISGEEYRNSRSEIMLRLSNKLKDEGLKTYIIPEGASNGIGNFGYFNAMNEIIKQEEELGLKYDMIVTSVGSGGTYGGLFMANKLLEGSNRIYGVNVCDDAEAFKNRIYEHIVDCDKYLCSNIKFSKDEINIIDGYVGLGYSESKKEEIDFICKIAQSEGIILDPVYTGKAMYGLYNEIKKGNFKDVRNILFIHTGGLLGVFPKKEMFN